MGDPTNILELAYDRAAAHLDTSFITDGDVLQKVEFIARNNHNRAVVRMLLACVLAKLFDPQIDIRKPYTEIGGGDSFSGRTYDEHFVGSFVSAHHLPCNQTTAFLTPAFR